MGGGVFHHPIEAKIIPGPLCLPEPPCGPLPPGRPTFLCTCCPCLGLCQLLPGVSPTDRHFPSRSPTSFLHPGCAPGPLARPPTSAACRDQSPAAQRPFLKQMQTLGLDREGTRGGREGGLDLIRTEELSALRSAVILSPTEKNPARQSVK